MHLIKCHTNAARKRIQRAIFYARSRIFPLLLLFPFLIFVETVEKLIFITQLGYKYYKCDWLGWVRPF